MVASVTRLRIAAATVEYFEADGYYTRGDPEHRRASRWYGAATKVCGLANRTVTARAFAAVLEGRVPRTDLRLGRLRDGAHQHLPGIDVTFSAPKSVSLEALVYAPAHTRARLRNAHDGAVRAALDFLERELLQTRGYDRATRRRPRVAAHGLLAALFRHATNRNLDPQLHTHGVIANMTRNAQGAWRSAEFTAVFRAKKLLGAYYRAELQRRVEAIGYATVPTLVGTVPGFEIAGYPKALLEAFSTRRRDLLAWLEARGLAYTPANAQQAVLATRRRKAAPDRDALPALWRRRAAECARGRDPRAVRRRGAPVPPAPSPLEVARRAVEHLAERSTLFTAHDLRGYALAYGGGRQTLPAIDAAVAALQRDRLLLETPADGADRAFTTRGAAAAEREVLRRMREGLDAGCALADPDRVAATLAPGSLNAGQRAAVTTVLLAPHRLVGVQGYAGTGKTTMLRAVARLAAGVPLLGLAPSTGAARVLVPDERTTAAGLRLLPPLIRSLAAADRDLPADVRALREGTRATARTLEAALQYDDDAAAMVDRVRARRQQADRDAVPWFSGEDGAGLCTAIERLSDAARSGPLAALVVLPSALARARWELRRAVRRLAAALRVSERLTGVLKARADGLQAADHDGIWFQASRAYGPWRREADAVLRLTEKMGAARTRYEPLMKARDELARSTRAHTDLRPPPGPVSWTSFASSADALRNQLRRDDAIQRLERTRKARYGQARLPWRPIPYHRKGYRAYIDELQHFHLTGAPGEVPPAFAAVVDEHRIQAALNQTVTEFLADGLPRLEALSDRRDVIRRHAAARGATVLDLGDHFTWSDDAAALVTTAQELLDGPEYKPHLRAARVRAERIRKALAPVQRQLDVDREAEGVLRDWRDLVSGARQWRPPEDPAREPQSDTRGTAPGRPPFFEDGYDALIERVRAVHEKTRDTEPVPEFAEALDDHEALAATQGLVDHFLECIRDCTAKRRRLLERAARDSAPFRIAYPRQHAEWEDLGTAAELASDMLMADITQYGPHLRRDPRGWTAVWHSRFEVFASENLGGLPAAQLLRLHDHGAAIANQGNDPWTARELYDIQSAMWASLQQVSGGSPDPAAEDERRRGRDALAVLSNKRQVRALPLFLQMLAQSREGLDADAAAKGCAVVDLPGWEKWHKEAGQATEATRKLLADPDCRRFLERWPEHARDLHDRLPPLEARQREDHEILRTRRRQQAPARTGPHRARGRGRRKRSSPGGQDR